MVKIKKKQTPTFKIRIVDFKPSDMEINEPNVNVPIEIFEPVSNIVVASKNNWFSTKELFEKTDEDVLTMIFSSSLNWAQGIIENISENTLNNIELTNRYANVVGTVIDIPETAEEFDVQVEAAAVDKIKDKAEWEIPFENEEPIIIEIPAEEPVEVPVEEIIDIPAIEEIEIN